MLNRKQIALLIVLAAVVIAALALAFLPKDGDGGREEMIVIELWQIDGFEGGKGSRARYLQNKADKFFEDKRVYVNVTSLSADAARENLSAGNIPDMISYGAGFYGIEGYVNASDFSYLCWCRGGYVMITLNGDFSDVSRTNTVINAGRDNLVSACALLEGLAEADSAAPTEAYVALLNGEYKYLLGTQRDIYRMETRGADYRAKALTSFNDLYQNVSILCEGKNYESCLSFARHLNEDCAGVEELGMVSEKTAHTGTMADIQSAEYEYSIKSFVGEGYMESVRQAIKNGDANSLKNLLN